MSLQMRVYKEVAGRESKVMMGLSWRQLAAGAGMLAAGGGVYALFDLLLRQPDLGGDLAFLVVLPLAAWGWWRPKGLKPEKYVVYMVRHLLGPAVWLRDGVAAEAPKRTHGDERDRRSRTAGMKGATR